ncbi:MAG TPA: type II toxin-antitoxin system Phd/YefM family antitoxin [Chloroflexaceae bacterium]|nr:type II toxin-antitoxin system Phd/YefM family antitoxin [Chloroflexaceae bacterium]
MAKATDVDLQAGVLPISAAAAQLARLITQARTSRRPIIITQRGYPEAVLLDVRSYIALRAAAELSAPELGDPELDAALRGEP